MHKWIRSTTLNNECNRSCYWIFQIMQINNNTSNNNDDDDNDNSNNNDNDDGDSDNSNMKTIGD